MKYINADKLKAEINKRYRDYRTKSKGDKYYEGMADSLDYFEQFIDSLQKEQPEMDLEKEIDKYCEPIQAWQIQEAPYTSIENCARHFYELGELKARKEK